MEDNNKISSLDFYLRKNALALTIIGSLLTISTMVGGMFVTFATIDYVDKANASYVLKSDVDIKTINEKIDDKYTDLRRSIDEMTKELRAINSYLRERK